jgi:stage IV sporulation protein FB
MRTPFAVDTRRLGSSLGLLTRIRLHPLFLLLFVVTVGLGFWRDVAVLFILVMLHELGHAMVANHLGYEVEEVSLLPFGGVARLAYGDVGFMPRHEALIAIAGPTVNAALILFAYLMFKVGWWSPEFFTMVARFNLWIAVFNLLPGMPLDGGRVLRAARAREIGFERATREAYVVSIVLAVALLVLGMLSLWAGMPHLGMLVLGVFLLLSAWSGLRNTSMETIRFLDAKKKVARERPQEVRALAAPLTATVRDVVRRFAPDRYHMVYVLDREGGVATVLEEDELLEAVFAGRWLETLESWLKS